MTYFPDDAQMRDLKQFVAKHLHGNPSMLRLKYHLDKRVWLPFAINHIESLSKAYKKLEGLEPEFMPILLAVEQASSAAVARLHGQIAKELVPKCNRFVDLTCGLGIDCRAIVEALTPAVEAIAIERDELAALTAVYNFKAAGLTNINVIRDDCTQWLEKYSGMPFDLAFIDPARRASDGGRLYNIHDCSPDVSEMQTLFEAHAPLVMVKLSPMLDVTQTMRDLPAIVSLHIVDDGSECRELLAVLDFRNVASPKGINAEIVVDSIGHNSLRFTLAENAEAKIDFAHPVAGMWLYEPSPATMKAAPFGILSERFGLKKLHPNTHLFVTDTPQPSLPGRWHELIEVLDFSSKNIKNFAHGYPKADVAVRNFPLSAFLLREKLKVKAGGEVRVVGVTLRGDGRTASQGNQALLVLKK